MLMSIKNIARTKGYAAISKDDISEVVSKVHGKGRTKAGRRKIKRSEKHKVRNEISNIVND